MYRNNKKISHLIFKYIDGSISKDELSVLEEWKNKSDKNKNLFDRIVSVENFKDYYKLDSKIDKKEAWRKVSEKLGLDVYVKARRVLAYAAAIILPLLVSYLFVVNNKKDIQKVPVIAKSIIKPGSSKAKLILSDGKTISLGEVKKEKKIKSTYGVDIVSDDEQIKYRRYNKSNKKFQNKYNEIVVPKGGEYSLVLSDGSRIKLNSNTRLRYPLAFSDKKRLVYLKGEAFFEVKHSVSSPFIVSVDKMKVKVYGTRFNVNSNLHSKVETVLVEGKVSMLLGKKEYTLKPSQLGSLNLKTSNVKIKKVDTDLYTSWVDNEFIFRDNRLEDILHTLSLWYDVDIEFLHEDLKELRFSANLKRYKNVDVILKSMEETLSVKFIIRNKKIIVTK
ncbi:FecR family protein [Marinilabiliaceae bacterium JC040]|nr:FecR family protein [Marinilabiliaceae bacterium JC040]